MGFGFWFFHVKKKKEKRGQGVERSRRGEAVVSRSREAWACDVDDSILSLLFCFNHLLVCFHLRSTHHDVTSSSFSVITGPSAIVMEEKKEREAEGEEERCEKDEDSSETMIRKESDAAARRRQKLLTLTSTLLLCSCRLFSLSLSLSLARALARSHFRARPLSLSLSLSLNVIDIESYNRQIKFTRDKGRKERRVSKKTFFFFCSSSLNLSPLRLPLSFFVFLSFCAPTRCPISRVALSPHLSLSLSISAQGSFS